MSLTIRPRALREYYATLEDLRARGVANEMGLRHAFMRLLQDSLPDGWALVPEYILANRAQPDGTIFDENHVRRGYWEAKDTGDDLEREIHAKLDRGYPRENTIFEDGRRAVLYQDDRRAGEYDLTDRGELTTLLQRFLARQSPDSAAFSAAGAAFRAELPDMALDLKRVIDEERRENRVFAGAFAAFHDLCRGAIDPRIGAGEIEEMLVQHLLTERLFRNVFDNPEFTRRNAIAREVEKVIDALTSRHWNRDAFLRRHDGFYAEIEERACEILTWSEKQSFLNTIYERFFQGFSRRQADTHGVVYTPQAIVDFMCASVDAVLRDVFGKTLASPGVCILDPCVGTGNFIVNLLNRIHQIDPLSLERKYREELFCNEIMLLPYYIAALNIEHRYFELTGRYEPFEGLCFTDTLDLAEVHQEANGQAVLPIEFAPANTERVRREKGAEITVILGNPPYNVGQQNENDNNKNRAYPVIDRRIRETYVADSLATNRNKLQDPYVRFFRWAMDRLGDRDGVVCLVSNNSFVDQVAFDGMRKHLLQDFDRIYHLDLHGNVRKNPKLSGTTHNVFGIQVGVGITVAVRRRDGAERSARYFRVPDQWRKEEKLEFLAQASDIGGVDWDVLRPDGKGNWITEGMVEGFGVFVPMGNKETKADRTSPSVFATFTLGVATNRDSWTYGFARSAVAAKVQRLIGSYNAEVDRWRREGAPNAPQRAGDLVEYVDRFVSYDAASIKWSRDLKADLQRGRYAEFDDAKLRRALYRPYCRQFLFLDTVLNQDVFQIPRFFPGPTAPNTVICVTHFGAEKPFMVLATDIVPDLHLVGAGCGTQCFPLYVYDEDGSNRRENITEWALGQFLEAYGSGVSRRDIFHYVYGVLHHPEYRERYAANLRRELPRIPLVAAGQPEVFRAFAAAGERLMGLHLHYEEAEPWPLERLQNRDERATLRVTKMRLTPQKDAVIVNDFLTLAGIPPATFEYRLGNRCALEWVIDQYQVRTDRRSGIVSDPNRPEDPEYIVRLVGQVVRVSVETVGIIGGLPALDGEVGEEEG